MQLDPNFPPTFSNHRGLWYGGDYNPEQWSKDIWDVDARLMDQAHWNVATVGVFSWVSLEPEEGNYEFDWMADVLDRLHAGGRKAILATPSAAAPAWLSQTYPETLRVGSDGIRSRHGNRVNYCLTSPVYRAKSKAIAGALADRFGSHPALSLWHVSNEYGGACYCDLCRDAFRQWLQKKFDQDLNQLNSAYWTAFWGHTYTDWSQIEIPGAPHGETAIHGLTVDWKRFVSDQTLDMYLQESEPLRSKTPDIPVTTNFMGFYGGLDYWKWSPHVDIATWDSYPAFGGRLEDPSTWVSVAMTHDLNRSFKGGQPFLLMECTPSASNWYPEMILKQPGMNQMEGIQAIAHGSDSVQYFQWRQSRGGQEKFHGAVVGHDGTDRSRVFQDVAKLGEVLSHLGEVAGSHTNSEVAIIFDWENSWAIETACGPKQGPKGYLETCKAHYRPLLEASIPVDFVSSEGDFSKYRLLIAPMLYMLKPGVADALERFVQSGGILVTTYWSGIVDENDRCFLGGFPGGAESPLRRTLGIWSEEIDVIAEREPRSVTFAQDNLFGLNGTVAASTFCDLIHAETANILANYSSGFYAGRPAITVNSHGNGEAYYIASRNDEKFQTAFFGKLADKLSLNRSFKGELPLGVTARHRSGDRDFLFLLNLTAGQKEFDIERGWTNWVTPSENSERCHLGPYGTSIFVRERGIL